LNGRLPTRVNTATDTSRGQEPGAGTRLRAFLAPSFLRTLLFALLIALGGGGPNASAGELTTVTGSVLPVPGLRGNPGGGVRIGAKVSSLSELRWKNVVRQRIDVGCGAAALATILTYYFDFPTTEQELWQPLLAQALKGAGPDVNEVGVSLRHIRDVAAKGGLAAAAFRVEAKDLHKIRIPSIARVTINGYDHFVVFKQARGGRVYVADPAFGNGSYRLRTFARLWSGVLMGFQRRSGERPMEHPLQVGPKDERVVDSEAFMRVAAVTDVGRVPFVPRIFSFSKFPFVTPKVEGLRSVFPFARSKELEF